MTDYCTNPACREPLAVDHVLLVTTAHVRRFCSVACIEPSRQAAERARNKAYRPGDMTPEGMSHRIDLYMRNQRP